jgi:hypothetical protein
MAEMAEISRCDGVMAQIDAFFALAVFGQLAEVVGL